MTALMEEVGARTPDLELPDLAPRLPDVAEAVQAISPRAEYLAESAVQALGRNEPDRRPALMLTLLLVIALGAIASGAAIVQVRRREQLRQAEQQRVARAGDEAATGMASPGSG